MRTDNTWINPSPVELRLQGALWLGVALWTQGLPSYALQHPGGTATVIGALGFTWGLTALGFLFDKLR